jgi:hypothetical protein
VALAGLTFPVLWARYFALGGMSTPDLLQQILDGSQSPSRYDYDLIAQAINEAFLDQGNHHPVPYAEDIGLWPGDEDR